MNAHSFAFDRPVALRTGCGPKLDGLQPAPGPGSDPVPAALPEREWGLSAGQVALVTIAIVVLSEVIGLLTAA